MTFDSAALHGLFASPFDAERWSAVLLDLFGVRHDPDAKLSLRPKPFLANPAGDEVFPLGSFTTSDRYLVGLFRYGISSGSVLRRKVGLRALVKPFLGSAYDAALVVFEDATPGRAASPVWRFSFICDIKGEATAPKRFTYVFGDPGTPHRTPVDRFLELQSSRDDGKPVSFESMQKAFSVEALSDQFFNDYKEHYEDFVSYVTGKRFIRQSGKWVETVVGRPHRTLYSTFGRDDKRVRDYVKKLLGRLVFLHFLQKKGWLGASAGTWVDGDRAFLLHLFEKASPEQRDDFLDGVLENLFFGALNTDRTASGDFFSTGVRGVGKCRIPYLNGGLFERDELDRLRVKFPEEFFERLLRFFAEYNFTIDENDPDEAEVGIDPEMLGRIFENLLEDNKDKGAFYTPKEIVGYMCRQSLLAYLSEGATEADRSVIADFIETRDAAPISPALARTLDARLRDVKICDPAIGSGAFPMGLLRLLCDLRTQLAKEGAEAPVADIKRSVIENNVYGVDIEKGAVDIARLRFWLSLVVDEDEPSPLPNLDFKIMQGNSLVESWRGQDLSRLAEQKKKSSPKKGAKDAAWSLSAPAFQLTLFENAADIHRNRLRDLLGEWYSCSDHHERARLRADIRTVAEEQIQTIWPDFSFGDLDPSANSDFFLWHVWFSEVFDHGGFDIVIGNPPYISAPTQIAHPVLAAQREVIAKSNRYPLLFEKWDLYLAFIELGMRHLLRKDGNLAMIVPYSLTTQKYARKFREAAVADWTLTELSDLRGVKVFQNATVTNCIPFVQKSKRSNESVWISRADENGTISRVFNQPVSRLVIDNKKVVWNTDEEDRSTARHAGMHTLGDYCYISYGMAACADEKVARGAFKKEDLLRDFQDKIHCRHWVEGKDIERYKVVSRKFIEYGTKRSPGQLRRQTFPEFYQHPKILTNNLGVMRAALDDSLFALHDHTIEGCVLWRDLRGVENKSITASIKKFSTMSRSEMELLSETVDLRYLLGVMNSRYAAELLANLRGGDYHIYPEYVRAIPIPTATPAEQSAVASLVDRILSAKASSPAADTTSLETQIDSLVYRLYGLTAAEIATVEESPK